MERGDFYSSTGVELSSYEATAERITIVVKESLMAKYRVQFIGSGGRVLKEVASSTARYDITGSEGYVRARQRDSGAAN